MKSETTSLIISALQNHISRIAAHGATQNQQLIEVRQLRFERMNALEELTQHLRKISSQIFKAVPEKQQWRSTIITAESFLNGRKGREGS